MATAVFFHAHPDDEAIATGGTMALLADAGHRVVLVLATRGEHGEPVPGVLDEGEALAGRRSIEVARAAEVLGVARLEFLDYFDSGMMGRPTNRVPGAFWRADVDEAAERLVALLADEAPDLLCIYDPHGGYGHPDHIQVHRVGTKAARLLGGPRVVWVTMNRDRILADLDDFDDPEMGEDAAERRRRFEDQPFGMPEDELTHAIDVESVLDRKRAAMMAHASQIAEDSFFLAMAEDAFGRAFGVEYYCDPDVHRPPGVPYRTDLLG